MAPLSLLTPTRLLADTTSRTTYELGRLQAFGERWQYLVLGVAALAIVALAAWMVRRDTLELRRGVAWLLLVLRVGTLAALLVFFLHLEKRTETKVVHNSRVVVLVDTSLSMGLHDATGSAVPAKPNRLEQVVGVLGEGELLDALRAKHDVVLERFDADLGRVASFAKRAPDTSSGAAGSEAPTAAVQATERTSTAATVPAGWPERLLPQGTETRLGQSLRQAINEERSAPLAGVIVFSDGGQNAGIDPSAAVTTARDAKIPVFTVGIGADRRAANVRVSDLVAPARAYPGDSFTITGYLQAEGLSDRAVTVELSSRPAAAGKADDGKLVASNRVTLGGRGEIVPVKFDITPNETGRQMYRLRVKAPPEDSNPTDDQQEADVEIVDRKTKVLLVASGPTREYTFLRNQLQRDKQVVVDVWLQSAPAEGVSQDAHQLLTAFPSTAAELFEYDTIVAFDPDWREVEPAHRLARTLGCRKGGRAGRRGRTGRNGPLGAGSQDVQGPRAVPRRVQSPHHADRRRPLRFDHPLAARLHARGARSRVPLAGRHAPRAASKSGRASPACTATTPSAGPSPAPRSLPATPIPKPEPSTRGRSTWPASSTAPAACFTWPAARCGGCGHSTTATSNSSTPS